MKIGTAETILSRCEQCGNNCNECVEIGEILDAIMYLREIDAQEDAMEHEIERLTA